MSKTPNYDTKIKAILDAIKPGERVCALTGEKWNMTEEEISWYRKFNVPPHPWQPSTRMKQVCSFFTMFQFWYQTHPETGKKFLSVIHPLSGVQAIPDEEWFGKDFSSINQDINFTDSFFKQMRELQKHVPLPGTKFIQKPERSISLASFGDIDSYFTMACRSRESFFAADVNGIEESAEAHGGGSIQKSYRVLHSHRIFDCQFVSGCFDCINSSFLFDCRNCEYCFGAANKRNRKYLWWNEQLSKEEWEKRRKQVEFSCRSKLLVYQEQFKTFMKEQAVWPENFNEQCTNVIGEYMRNATDCQYVFSGNDGPFRNIFYGTYLYGNCYEVSFSGAPVSSNRIYLSNTVIHSSDVLFSHMVTNCQNVEYCFYCWNCENCFGCFGLQRKKFCIFNKPYTEEAYWQELDHLKSVMLEQEEYGLFFPAIFNIGYFMDGGMVPYAGTIEDAKRFGADLYSPEDGGAVGELKDLSNICDAESVPDCIDDVLDEDLAGKPFYDKEFKRRFAYIKPELAFYHRFHIAPPTKHFIRRVYELFKEQNSPIFLKGNCQNCGEKIIYTKNFVYFDRKIYCKACYLKYLEERG